MGQSLSGVFSEKVKFGVEDVPDLAGKVVIVTGGNTGIGKETIRVLLTRNAKVYMAARDEKKAKRAIEDLAKSTGKRAVFLHLDLTSLKSVRRAVDEFLSKEKALHILINNAAVMYTTDAPGHDGLTEDGYDVQWGTNVVGPFLFTKLLVPALLEGTAMSADRLSRVAFTASRAQTRDIQYETLTDTAARKKMPPKQRYAQSKFANVVLAAEFARQYGEKRLISFSLNPGGIKTDLRRHLPAGLFYNLFLKPPETGALTPLWGTTTASGEELNGKYLIPVAKFGIPEPLAQNREVGERLWMWLSEQTRDK